MTGSADPPASGCGSGAGAVESALPAIPPGARDQAVEAANLAFIGGLNEILLIGAGTGMQCYGFPGGIGTASRRVGAGTIGVLLLCNFGERAYLDLLEGTAAAAEDGPARPTPHGSCIAVCATDLPLSIADLQRLALRPLLGLVRTGSYGSEGSGEIGIAFTTGGGITGGEGVGDEALEDCFAAAYDAGREAVYNCLVAARPAQRLDGTMQPTFPVDEAVASARRDRLA